MRLVLHKQIRAFQSKLIPFGRCINNGSYVTPKWFIQYHILTHFTFPRMQLHKLNGSVVMWHVVDIVGHSQAYYCYCEIMTHMSVLSNKLLIQSKKEFAFTKHFIHDDDDYFCINIFFWCIIKLMIDRHYTLTNARFNNNLLMVATYSRVCLNSVTFGLNSLERWIDM